MSHQTVATQHIERTPYSIQLLLVGLFGVFMKKPKNLSNEQQLFKIDKIISMLLLIFCYYLRLLWRLKPQFFESCPSDKHTIVDHHRDNARPCKYQLHAKFYFKTCHHCGILCDFGETLLTTKSKCDLNLVKNLAKSMFLNSSKI